MRVLTTVGHCQDPHDVYIGRPSCWGNPFVVGKHGKRGECVDLYREWIQHQPQLLARLHELRGKRLGCWCKTSADPTRACHGDVLAVMANALPEVDWSDIDLTNIE